MKRALIVTNPMAARAARPVLDRARRRLVEGGLSVDVAPTSAPGHAEQLARTAVGDGIDLLIAHGGDGTVMEVAAALVGTGQPLGLLPAGTGNLLAGNLGVRRSPLAAADVILAGQVRTIDVGRLETPTMARYFAVAAGVGFDAELMRRTEHLHKRTFGVGAYVATAVRLAREIERATFRIETESVTVEAQAASVLVANCRELIPGVLPLAGRGIEPDDGLLNIVVLDARSLSSAVRVAWSLFLRRGAVDPGITYLTARRVRITADRDLPVQADGEACGRAPISITVVPGGLAVFAPAPRLAAR